MKRRRGLVTAAALVSLALLGAACGNDDDGGAVSDATASTAPTTTTKPKFAAGSTMEKLQTAGKITVGTKFDQPGFGLKNPTTGKVEGFDVEVAKILAAALFGEKVDAVESKINFVEAVSKNREPFIQQGTVDIVAATYTINDTRKQIVDFAGPYFVAKQDIMVKKDNTTIKAVTDLAGKKVCSVKGSTSEKNVIAKAPTAVLSLFDTYSLCAEALTDGRVEAVTTDNTILAGLIKASSGAFKLVENPFSDEPYGIGLKKGDDAFRTFVNDTLAKSFTDGSWAKAFEATLGTAGLGLKTPSTPTLDRYTVTPAAPTTTTTAAATTSTTK
jgi:glutamate transport system substrate-binding protein